MEVKNINKLEFEKLIQEKEKVILIDFFATWCGPCKMLSHSIEELASNTKNDIIIAKVDVDENQELASMYNVMSVPTILIFKDGELVNRESGFKSTNDLEEMINI